ncbi:hypothetical protein NMG60_11026704 [Bertholletia excelsa]
MGVCLSVRERPDSKLKLKLKLVSPSPADDAPIVNGDSPTSGEELKSKWSPSRPAAMVHDFGSREETFFDSQAWLDSDCDDDFFSVKGDFTPSRGSTPVHHKFSDGAPRINAALSDNTIPGSKPEPSPKKRLSELFQESFRRSSGDLDDSEPNKSSNQNEVSEKIEARPIKCNPRVAGTNSVCSSERNPSRDYRPKKEKLLRSVQGCLPIMLSSCSSSDERKKMSPPHV